MTKTMEQAEQVPIKQPKVVRVNYVNFWREFNHASFRKCLSFLSDAYDLQLSDEPQVVFESVFGRAGIGRRRWPNALQVWFTGENVTPPLDEFDYCLSFYRDLDDPRHFRWPLFSLHTSWYGYSFKDLLKLQAHYLAPHERPRFCAFIASNGGAETRNAFVKKLSQYRPVDCPGAVLNNMPTGAIGPPGDFRSKIEFLESYKFTVCFENTATNRNEGYVTEKLTNAMLAGCVPLYWGDHRVGEDFNPHSFLDLNAFEGDMDAMIQAVIKLDQNDALCQRIAGESWFHDNQVPQHLQVNQLHDFFARIFSRIPGTEGSDAL